jgi:hypothetical protein
MLHSGKRAKTGWLGKYKFFVIISALPVQGKSLTVQKWDRVTLQIEQDINDIKETKWFIRDIDGKLISIQPDNNRYNGGCGGNRRTLRKQPTRRE